MHELRCRVLPNCYRLDKLCGLRLRHLCDDDRRFAGFELFELPRGDVRIERGDSDMYELQRGYISGKYRVLGLFLMHIGDLFSLRGECMLFV